MEKCRTEMAEDILKNMEANGTTLETELTTINDFIKTKPEYKTLYNNTYWTGLEYLRHTTIGGKNMLCIIEN